MDDIDEFVPVFHPYSVCTPVRGGGHVEDGARTAVLVYFLVQLQSSEPRHRSSSR